MLQPLFSPENHNLLFHDIIRVTIFAIHNSIKPKTKLKCCLTFRGQYKVIKERLNLHLYLLN